MFSHFEANAIRITRHQKMLFPAAREEKKEEQDECKDVQAPIRRPSHSTALQSEEREDRGVIESE